MQGWFYTCKSSNMIHHINKTKDNKSHAIPIDAGKASDEIQCPFMIKNSHQCWYRRNISQHNKGFYEKCTANILSSEKVKVFPLNSGKDKDAHSHQFYLS